MNLNIKTTKEKEKIVDFLSNEINHQLELGKKVLWFATGGSSIPVQVLVSQKINKELSNNLVITLTDERFGPVNHDESNWSRLQKLGFNVPGAKLIPFLSGKSFSETTKDLREIIKQEIEKSDYKIGMFGIGIDGHTAGILPNSDAVNIDELVCSYETPMFDRITITPKVISMLDEAVVYSMGDMKWPILEKLEEDIPLIEDPSQILKKVPLLTIFTDYIQKNISK